MGLEHDPVTLKTFLTFRKMVFLTEILLDSFVILATAVTFRCEYIEIFQSEFEPPRQELCLLMFAQARIQVSVVGE
jgi:hypothetical protein